MTWRSTSIRGRLLLYGALCAGLLLGISGFAIASIVTLANLLESFDSQWLTGTQRLGEIGNLVSKFRIDEYAITSSSSTTRSIAVAKVSAETNAYGIGKQLEAYAALGGPAEEMRLVKQFDSAWGAYLAEHRAWALMDEGMQRGPAFQMRSETLYASTERAIAALIGENRTQSRAAIGRGEFVVEISAGILSLAAVLGLCMVGWITFLVTNRISRPLVGITDALTALAAGNRDVVIPKGVHQDEIAKMAQSFEVFRANAVALEEAQAQAEAFSRYDSLTGLANRRVFSSELEKALGRFDRGEILFAVLVIDLDRFKPVNDLLGHRAGDLVLAEITARLRLVVRKQDTLARIGGDEFAIISEIEHGEQLTQELAALAERIITTVSAPVSVGARSVAVGASVGIAICPADGQVAEALLRAADIAMYRAKGAGPGLFRFYEESMDAELRARAALETDIHRALLDGEVRPHYQPLINLSDGRLLGFEILARWYHPEKGLISPEVFVPVIEHIGEMSDFTLSILRTACLHAKEWPADLKLSLNLSPHELSDLVFPMRLLAVLSETNFSPHRLEIEITENALVVDLGKAKTILETLQSLGITIALDDFGTGYSSLYHLRELHLDKIKIDRSFIQSMKENPESAKIVFGILGLAKSLALPTTAEGIEDPEILERLSKAGCEIGQGYYFGKAMPAAEIADWIREHRRAPAHGPKVA